MDHSEVVVEELERREGETAEEIAAFYQGDNLNSIRFGLLLVLWGAAIFVPFAVTVADYIARIEGRPGPLTRMMTLAGYSNALFTFCPPLFWLVATYRPHERSIELTWLLNDMGWLMFIGAIALVLPMFIVLGVAALNDNSENPVFPRWLAFYSFFTFVMFIPDQLLFFFKSGPFAWNGLIGFWLPIAFFFVWMVGLMLPFTARAIARQMAEEQSMKGRG